MFLAAFCQKLSLHNYLYAIWPKVPHPPQLTLIGKCAKTQKLATTTAMLLCIFYNSRGVQSDVMHLYEQVGTGRCSNN